MFMHAGHLAICGEDRRVIVADIERDENGISIRGIRNDHGRGAHCCRKKQRDKENDRKPSHVRII